MNRQTAKTPEEGDLGFALGDRLRRLEVWVAARSSGRWCDHPCARSACHPCARSACHPCAGCGV